MPVLHLEHFCVHVSDLVDQTIKQSVEVAGWVLVMVLDGVKFPAVVVKFLLYPWVDICAGLDDVFDSLPKHVYSIVGSRGESWRVLILIWNLLF